MCHDEVSSIDIGDGGWSDIDSNRYRFKHVFQYKEEPPYFEYIGGAMMGSHRTVGFRTASSPISTIGPIWTAGPAAQVATITPSLTNSTVAATLTAFPFHFPPLKNMPFCCSITKVKI